MTAGLPGDPYAALIGTASDDVPGVLATGQGDIAALFVSMSARDPQGNDAQYLTWHTLDHRPEQHRLSGIRASLRFVSTPACRAARAASDAAFDVTDHLMTYFFSDLAHLKGFTDLADALRDAGRMTYALPSVQHGIYDVADKLADPAIKAGADVLPWWPAKGLYLLIEHEAETPRALVDQPGVIGLWSGTAQPIAGSRAMPGQRITYLFLDEDPVAVAERLRPVLAQRWNSSAIKPLFAAPFHPVVPHAWDRYLP